MHYQDLLNYEHPPFRETRQSYHCLTERHLQAVWFEQKYFKTLRTLSGDSVEVISPGIWNAEAGPDFLKAHIRIGGIDRRGDIEIHFGDENWYHHHHHLDERYNQVIVHLSLWKSDHPKPILTKHENHVVQLYLEPFLTIPHARITQLIDLDLYPYKKFLGSGQCAQAVFRTLSEQKIKSFFKAAAQWRLEKKLQHLRVKTTEQSYELSLGIAMALGYKHNSEAFLDVYFLLMQLQHLPLETLFAQSLGICGFFEEPFQKKWSHSDYYHFLLSTYLNSASAKNIKLVLNQVRPMNHPVRRLFFLTKLALDTSLPALQTQMLSLWQQNWQKIQSKKNRIAQELREMIPTYQDTYWNHHYTFESTPKSKFLTLIGDDLKTEILINTFFPLLQEDITRRCDPNEMTSFQNFFASLPAANTRKTKYLSHRFFGDGPKKAIFRNAIAEQGAYQVHRDFCMHYEASCDGCPFIERFKTRFLE